MFDAVTMPSVPSRLAAVFACALALMLAAPALADKKPGGGGNTPPGQLPSLQPPGQTSEPAPSTTPKAQTPTVSTPPPSTGGTSGFTQKVNKGKHTGFLSKPKQKGSSSGGSSSGFTRKQDKGSS